MQTGQPVMTDTNSLKQKYVAGSLERPAHALRASPTATALLELLRDRFGQTPLSILLLPLKNVSSYLDLAEQGHLLSAFDSSHTAIADAYLKAYQWGVYDRCQFTAVREHGPLPYFLAEFDVIVLTEGPIASATPPHRELAPLLKQGGLIFHLEDERTFVAKE